MWGGWEGLGRGGKRLKFVLDSRSLPVLTRKKIFLLVRSLDFFWVCTRPFFCRSSLTAPTNIRKQWGTARKKRRESKINEQFHTKFRLTSSTSVHRFHHVKNQQDDDGARFCEDKCRIIWAAVNKFSAWMIKMSYTMCQAETSSVK